MSPSRLTIDLWPATHPGQADANEDAVMVYRPADPRVARSSGVLIITADGQGGAERGRLASSYAVRRIMHAYYTSDEPDLGLRLREAVELANSDLYAYAQQRPELVKLGTTVVAAAMRGEELHIASVGNSRAYLIRDGQIRQITRDHTLVQQLLEEGAVTPEEARVHPRREVMLRALGSADTVQVDVFDVRLKPDDSVLLCTDGLTRYLDADEIANIVGGMSPRNAAETLIQKANDRGGEDNISAISALARDGAPVTLMDLPYAWDGGLPSFEAMPTLTMRPPEPAPAPDAEAAAVKGMLPEQPAGDETVRAQRITREQAAQAAEDAGWEAAGTQAPPPPQAPPYQATVQPAPQYGAPAPQAPPPPQPGQQQYGPAQPRGYQPPPGYEYDPVTGLPPTPIQGPGQPSYAQQQRPTRAPRQAPSGPAYPPRPRRGIPLGVFLLVAMLTVILVVGMVFVLVNPFNWDLANVAGIFGGAEATPDATQTAQAVPTQPLVEDIVTPEPAEPTPMPTQEVVAPPGMVLVDAGGFPRGVGQDEIDEAVLRCIQLSEDKTLCYPEYFSDATPVQEITLSPFFIDINEVTNADYAGCVAAGICTPPSDETFYADPAFALHPVVYVNYQQATTYCNWAGKRLPTEAEWEKAARFDPLTGEAYWFPWGNQYEPGRANTASAGLGGTAAVGSFPQDASAFGVLDLAGNVSEWVSDWYFPGYEGLGTLNPTGPANQPLPDPFRVGRGGSFRSLEPYARAGQRLDVPPSSQANWLGFRCVADVPGAAPLPTPTTEATETPAGTGTPTGEAPAADTPASPAAASPTDTPQP
mgnify:CR=1 FL=1